MSLTACEAFLLDNKKDEIWQLLYVERRSVEKAYEILVSNGGGWIGERRFREAITRWERDDPQVWPSRLEYRPPNRCAEPHADSVGKSSQEYLRLHGDALWSISKTLGENEQINQGYMLSSTGARGNDPTNSESALSLSGGTTAKVGQGFGSNPNPYSSSYSTAKSDTSGDGSQKQSLAERLQAGNERLESPTVNWLLNTPPLAPKPTKASEAWNPRHAVSVLSQRTYPSNTPAVCGDCGVDHSTLQMYTYDSSSSYTFVPYPHGDLSTDFRSNQRECAPAVQPASKPVTQIFGYIVSSEEDNEDSESTSGDECDDNDEEDENGGEDENYERC